MEFTLCVSKTVYTVDAMERSTYIWKKSLSSSRVFFDTVRGGVKAKKRGKIGLISMFIIPSGIRTLQQVYPREYLSDR
jgi:hypothetical protein